MTQQAQAEALYLASILDLGSPLEEEAQEAAVELRRLHGRVQELEAQLATQQAAEQERKPLTDEQILDVLQLTNPKPSGLVVRIVRAIEHAHGIQEPS